MEAHNPLSMTEQKQKMSFPSNSYDFLNLFDDSCCRLDLLNGYYHFCTDIYCDLEFGAICDISMILTHNIAHRRDISTLSWAA